jgi:hypothetical protein
LLEGLIMLFLIMLGFIALCVIFGAVINDWHRGEGAAAGLFVGFVITVFGFMCLQFIGMATQQKSEQVTYRVELASLRDGSETEGHFYLHRGQIGEVAYFSYYRGNGDGSYSLDKKEADRSVVIPDATPETAHVMITDDIHTCMPSWWFVTCPTPNVSGIYVHGDFHVPADSIKQDFVLDAQ